MSTERIPDDDILIGGGNEGNGAPHPTGKPGPDDGDRLG